MIPEADRVVLEQQGAHLGVRSSLRPGGVVFQAGGSRVNERTEGDRVGVKRGGHALDPTIGREQQARLAAVGRQRPEGRDLVVRVGLGVRIGPRGGEEEGAVVGEGGRRFAPARARQPARGGLPGRVDLPQRGAHLVGLGPEAADGNDQAPPVGRQLQAG